LVETSQLPKQLDFDPISAFAQDIARCMILFRSFGDIDDRMVVAILRFTRFTGDALLNPLTHSKSNASQ